MKSVLRDSVGEAVIERNFTLALTQQDNHVDHLKGGAQTERIDGQMNHPTDLNQK